MRDELDLPENESVELKDAWGIKYVVRDDLDADELVVRTPMWFANIMIHHEELKKHGTSEEVVRETIENEARSVITNHILNDPTVRPIVEKREDLAYQKGRFANTEQSKVEHPSLIPTTLPNGWFDHKELRLIFNLINGRGSQGFSNATITSMMTKLERALGVKREYYEI